MTHLRFFAIALLVALPGCPLSGFGGPSETGSACTIGFDSARTSTGPLSVEIGDTASGRFVAWSDGSEGNYKSGGQGLTMISLALRLSEHTRQCVLAKLTIDEPLSNVDAGAAADAGSSDPDPIAPVQRLLQLCTDGDGVLKEINIPISSGFRQSGRRLRVSAAVESPSGADGRRAVSIVQ